MKVAFSSRLKQLRLEANIKQLDLAKALNTTQRRISYLEIGKIEPDLETLCLIANYFNVSTDYLLGLQDY